ncbi:UvrD-helicase domain-containing protein [Cuneatibacter sp. NSJ-177]|uniref:UvrD-helicase domain-containing protein n=1 Tax=Cuneatibacter sp. NSJ-177 TaxID=2931401 RepID=UPI001FCFE3D7|nr:UvrD-helicase domain-containing protein [Cuneatibacter sp. NSJ-177]MCJ7837337.1 UvrD-helicase domain-containing protein [Cuneatibacter sp. NSJ-177]
MYIGDLHIHSRYSRATSKDCTPEYLDLWARKKGIDIVGTGDFTHPAWREELKEKLEPAEDGFYVLKKEYRIKDEETPDDRRPRFVVTGEISSIYKKWDRVRKVHSLLILPNLEDADRLARRLELIGNIHSDGRPILGLDCRDLLEIMLETCPQAVYVPAHIWTPHFSLFGAFSGFDRIEDCFGDLTSHVHALETGLSSDPPMNWRISALDSFQLISNSDAHSPAKLGREANLFDMDLCYDNLARAINQGEGLAGTLEFFPEEGKYHFDGHRKCGLSLDPKEALKYGNICPVCGKKLTIGVLHRVEELADREEGYQTENAKPFESLVPLPEVIAASTGGSAAGKKVQAQYGRMLYRLGSEFSILRQVPVEDIQKVSGPLVAEGIKRLREGRVERTPGFDGEYGKIQLLDESEISSLEGQLSLFTQEEWKELERKPVFPALNLAGRESAAADQKLEGDQESGKGEGLPELGFRPLDQGRAGIDKLGDASGSREPNGAEECAESGGMQNRLQNEPDPCGLAALNPQQREAACAEERAVAVIAGPGAGKTKTLITRLLYMLEVRKIEPSEITAVTFTNQAAAEMRSRLEQLPGGKRLGKQMRIGTFHSICSQLLTESGRTFTIADEGMQREFAEQAKKKFGLKLSAANFLRELSLLKSGMESGGAEEDLEEFREVSLGEAREELLKDVSGSPMEEGRDDYLLEAGDKAWKETPEEPCEDRISKEAAAFYQEKMEAAGALDYDDLLLEGLRLFTDGEERPAAEADFSYLLVDEFQDINPIQYQLIKAWNQNGRELFVIGDPDQSIYGFRGSDSQCFTRLKEEHPDLRTIRLVYNYRSTPEILSGALSVIGHNSGEARRMEAAGKAGRPVRIVKAPGEKSEAIFIAKEINRLIGGIDMVDVEENESRQGKEVRSFSDLAVLYRTHRQAKLLEECLRQEGIPYVVAGREDFLLEPKVRGALYFFQYVLHPDDMTAKEQAEKLIWPSEEETAGDRLALLAEKYQKKAQKGKPVKLLEEWAKDTDAGEDEAMKKLADLSVLSVSMEAFLHTLSFGEEGDIRRSGGRKFTSDAVTLMTFHGSKGLEFPVVFLYGIRKGLVPLEVKGKASDWEEERRLFFVGMTRAREELILTTSGEESAFLKEILPESAIREAAKKEKPAEEITQLSLFDFI